MVVNLKNINVMEDSNIRHDARLRAIWIKTNDLDYAKDRAELFLKELETDDDEFKIDTFGIWKKDNSYVKIEYRLWIKEGGPTWFKRKEEDERVFSLIKIDIIDKTRTRTVCNYRALKNRYLIECGTWNSHKIIDLRVKESIKLYYYFEYDDGSKVHYNYKVTRIS